MATEIIRTDDPNIVIERTIIDNPIDVESIRPQIEGIETLLSELRIKQSSLKELKSLPKIAKEIVDKEIGNIAGEIFTYENELEKLNRILNA